MATDHRIGIGHMAPVGEIAGAAIMSSGTKRKMEELGDHLISAAVGDVVARTMSAAVGRYEARASMDDQLERLGMLLIMVHSAVEAAEGVHIRTWWLRRWLWRLRDAALDGDEVLQQSLRQRWRRGGAGEVSATDTDTDSNYQASGKWLWNTARRVFQSAKTLVFAGDRSSVRLSGAVARLERVATGLPEFLKMLDMEMCRSLPPVAVPASTRLQLLPSSTRRHDKDDDEEDDAQDPSPAGCHDNPIKEEILHGVLDVAPRCRCTANNTTLGLGRRQDVSRSDDDDDESETTTTTTTTKVTSLDVSCSSYVYTATRRRIGELVVLQRTPRPVGKLVMPPPASNLQTTPARLRGLVADIRRVIRASDPVEVHGRRWVAEWHRELQGVADRANRVPTLVTPKTAVVADAEADGESSHETIGDDDVKRTTESVEIAAAGLECFVRLVRFAVLVRRLNSQDKGRSWL